ncbi:MAG: hypothetical protein WC141_03845 [Arcobacteraceae bacterium]
MNIEHLFIKKAIQEKNYICFNYKNRHYNKVKPMELKTKKEQLLLVTPHDEFEFEHIKKLTVLKDRF